MQDTVSEQTAKPALDRRGMLRSSAIGAAGALALGAVGTVASSSTAHADVPLTDINILNFALNLEYLEAEFYLQAAFGRGLSAADINGIDTLGPVRGGRQVTFATPIFRDYAEEIAMDEEAHVKLLRSALGGAKVARPTIDIGTAFTTGARAAGLIGPTDTFDPYANENNFLLAAFLFEDVGVTAYRGAAPFIRNRNYLSVAAGLLGVEAYHASEIRLLLLQRGFAASVQKLSDLRDGADGSTDLDQGILINGKANIVPTDRDSLVFARTPQQVLGIVYLGGAAANFGFFPDMLNGELK